MGLCGSLYAGDPAPGFVLTAIGLDDCIDGRAGSTVEFEVAVSMSSVGLAPEDEGAQGWSLSVSADGWDIVNATTAGTASADVNDNPPGLRNTGFEISELTDGSARDGSDCAGRLGAVSAVVLSFVMNITLPTDAASDILIVTVAGVVPPDPEPGEERSCVECRVDFTDGCTGSGQPVDNKVTLNGETVRPELVGTTVCVCSIIDCSDDGRVNVTTTASAADGDNHVSDSTDLPDEDAKLSVEVKPGEIGSLTVYANFVSIGLSSGLQGWSLAASISGDIVASDITDAGTASADSPDGLRDTGFQVSETVDPALIHPDTGEAQGEGIVTATVLSFVNDITLPTSSTATAVCITVETAGPMGEKDTIEGSITWLDNMTGSGQPVKNAATISGNTIRLCSCQTARFCFIPKLEIPFIRCDPNIDGESNLADAVFIVNQLFRGGIATTCDDSADCNNDGTVDLSDATYSVSYRFSGGSPPPPPFPNCGEESETDEVEDELTCDVYDPCDV
jgi:hypothetical protein